jgi:hypothetical protein
MTTSKKEQTKKLWIRIICFGLVIILIGSTLLAALGIF